MSPRFFELFEHPQRLTRDRDPFEILEAVVDFEHYRRWLVEYLDCRPNGGRLPFAPTSMLKARVLQA